MCLIPPSFDHLFTYTTHSHVQIAHLSSQSTRLRSNRPNDQLSISTRSGHLADFTIRSPLVRLTPSDRVLVNGQKQSVGTHRSRARGSSLAANRRASLTARIGRLEAVEGFVVEPTDTACGGSRTGGGWRKAGGGRCRVVERVRKSPTGG